MRYLPILALVACAVAQNYPGEDAARLNESTIHPDFHEDLNYLRARANEVVPGVYVCKGPGWTNDCVWQRVTADVCMALPISDTLAVGVSIFPVPLSSD